MKTPKLFGLGLSRTGTTSLHAALVLLDKASIHYPGKAAGQWLAANFSRDPLVEFDACLDLPTPVYFRELDKAYPGSRFILTVRDDEQWLESVRDFLAGTPTHSQKTSLRDMIRLAVYGTADFHQERFRRIFNEHNDAVQAYFRHRPEQLLVMDITSGDGWDKLVPFLGEGATPTRPFPRLRSPYLGALASVSRTEIKEKRGLLEQMLYGSTVIESDS